MAVEPFLSFSTGIYLFSFKIFTHQLYDK